MKFGVFLILLVPTIGVAAVDVGLPNIEDISIAENLASTKDSQSREALKNAQKAFFLQYGVSNSYNKKVKKEVNNQASVAEKSTEETIDDDTPLRHQDVFIAAGAAYIITYKKEYTQGFKDPWGVGIDHYITLGQHRYVTGIKVEF